MPHPTPSQERLDSTFWLCTREGRRHRRVYVPGQGRRNVVCLGDRTQVLRETRLESSRRHHKQGLCGQVEMVESRDLGAKWGD